MGVYVARDAHDISPGPTSAQVVLSTGSAYIINSTGGASYKPGSSGMQSVSPSTDLSI